MEQQTVENIPVSCVNEDILVFLGMALYCGLEIYELKNCNKEDYSDGKDYIDASKPAIQYGPDSMRFAKAERPQVLLINWKPEYL